MLFLKYVGRNDLSHSDCGIFKSTISPQQIDETALFFSMLIQIHKNQNECGRSGLWTLKLTDGTNWFFTCWYSFTPTKKWLKICGASMVKNGCSQFGDGTLKLTVSEEWVDGIHKLICMLIHDHRNWKLIKKFFGWALSKMGVASLVTELKNERTE